jgi:hypothetical protein
MAMTYIANVEYRGFRGSLQLLGGIPRVRIVERLLGTKTLKVYKRDTSNGECGSSNLEIGG